MTADEVKIAAVLSFHRLCAEENIAASDFSDRAKMAWQTAFVAGALWMQEKCDEAALRVLAEAKRSIDDDARGG